MVLSEYGIFVIETKNYSGWILGGEYSEEWTKNVYGKKYKFRNPLKQNYTHVNSACLRYSGGAGIHRIGSDKAGHWEIILKDKN